MAFRALQLTIPTPAAATVLSDALPAAERAGGVSISIRSITFQVLKASTGDIFIGDSNLTSSTVHAFRVDPADTQQPIIIGGHDEGPMKLGDFWAMGTAGDVLLIGYVPY